MEVHVNPVDVLVGYIVGAVIFSFLGFASLIIPHEEPPGSIRSWCKVVVMGLLWPVTFLVAFVYGMIACMLDFGSFLKGK